VIPRLTKIIRSGVTFVSRNVMLSGVSLLVVSNVNKPVGLVGLPYVMWSAHFFVTHIQTEKISSWNGPTVHVCCFMLPRVSTTTFVSRVRKQRKNLRYTKNSLAGSLVSRGITVFGERCNEMGGACGTYGGRGVHGVLMGRPEGKRPLGRPRHRWGDNIKLYLQEVTASVV
jgi:hypothetical protein